MCILIPWPEFFVVDETLHNSLGRIERSPHSTSLVLGKILTLFGSIVLDTIIITRIEQLVGIYLIRRVLIKRSSVFLEKGE